MLLSTAVAAPAVAQQQAVCLDQPGIAAASNADNYRVLCVVEAQVEKDIAIDLDSLNITTTGRQHHGVAVIHYGKGGVAIDLASSSITVNEVNSHGIYGRIYGRSDAGISSVRDGAKDLRIKTTGTEINIDVTAGSSQTEKVNGHGIYGRHDGVGHLRIEATGTDIDIDTDFVGAYRTKTYGIYGEHLGTGNLTIDVEGGSIKTNRQESHGIHGSHEGEGELDIDAAGVKIETGPFRAPGIYGEHLGTGNLTIDVEGGSIKTKGYNSHGIQGLHDGAGNLRIEATDVVIDNTGVAGAATYGMYGLHRGSSGGLTVDVEGGSIDTMREGGHAVIGFIQPAGDDKGGGDLRIDVRGGSFRTRGKGSLGFYIVHRGASGNVVVNVRGADIYTYDRLGEDSHGISVANAASGAGKVVVGVRGGFIDTKGRDAHGIRSNNGVASGTGDIDIDLYDRASVTTNGVGARGIMGWNSGASSAGDIDIDVWGGASVTTNGRSAHGIYGLNSGTSSTGGIDIDVSGDASVITNGVGARGIMGWNSGASSAGDIDIDVSGDAFVTTNGGSAFGIYGLNSGTSSTGGIDIDVSDHASVTTNGGSAHGIYGLNYRTSSKGGIDIGVSGSASITTSGAGAHGIHTGIKGGGAVSAAVSAGASVTADGANASGVQIGRFNATTKALDRAAEAGADGYRKQTVTVNGSVSGGSGEAAGVYLAGGGKAVLGPAGTVGADSGIAIYAARKLLTDPAPKLHVSLNLGGRQVMEVLGDDWIINDGGETTILVNGVELHNGASGATGYTAVNGAWDVTIRRDGRTVDRTDPDNWTISDRSESTIRDRDFSAADFTETQARSGTPPTSEPNPPFPRPPTPPGATPAPGSSSGGSGSGGGGALVGGALLALLVLMPSTFDLDPEVADAGMAPRPAFVRSTDGETRHWARGLSGPLSAAGGKAGVEFGLDAGLGGGFWLGFAAAPGMAAARADGGASVSGGRYSLRGGWRSEALFAGLSASRADWEAETAFATPVGGLVAGAFDAQQTDLRLGAGGRLALGGGFSLVPKAEVFTGQLERDAHRADGSAFRADMPEVTQRYRGWKADLGLASGWQDLPRDMKLRPMLNLSALRTESRSDSFALTQSDRHGIVETSVRARMVDPPRTVLGLAAGIEGAGRGGLHLSIGYAAMLAPSCSVDHALAASLKVRF